MKKIKNLLTDPLNIIILLLLILNILPLLAPVFMHFEWRFLSKPIYFVYSFFCHQFHHRSLHLFDNQCAWCARDTGIWFGWLIGAIALKYKWVNSLRFIVLPLFILPMIMDGGIQTLFTLSNINSLGEIQSDFYISNNFTRMITGILFGIGMSLWFIPFVMGKDLFAVKNYFQNKFLNTKYFRILSMILIGILFYLLVVQLWNATSNSYRPTNILDSTPKISKEAFFERRTNGECTTQNNELINFKCFF